jgi:hypothetical protein
MNETVFKNTIVICDQQSIPASFNAVTLFLNGWIVIESCNDDGVDINEIANNLSDALSIDVQTFVVTSSELSRTVANKRDTLAEYEKRIADSSIDGEPLPEIYDEWIQGYDNSDMLDLIETKLNSNSK